MTKDKQLSCVNLEEARSKRDSDAGLTIKEWCLLAGYSYSKGRAIVSSNDFPIFGEKIVWSDWIIWRRNQVGLVAGPRLQKPSVPKSASLNKFYARLHSHD